MSVTDLRTLDAAVALLLDQASVRNSIECLKAEMGTAPEPFVWAVGGRELLAEVLPPERVWHVIERNVAHEFFPERTDMVVLSFHTCAADELEEIESGTGKSRFYEPRR